MKNGFILLEEDLTAINMLVEKQTVLQAELKKTCEDVKAIMNKYLPEQP